nr:MAG TPA: hypothetical protein [Caudoviricetes sp.]
MNKVYHILLYSSSIDKLLGCSCNRRSLLSTTFQ